MSWLDAVHGGWVHPHRLRVLSQHFASILPSAASVLDVGCGDGRLANLIAGLRPDLSFHAIDVLLRPDVAIPVSVFDGNKIPFERLSFDVVMFSDVLHHAADPAMLLREASRVARWSVAIKDHVLTGPLARRTLAFMDRVGNLRHGIALPFNYWTYAQWTAAFEEARLEVEVWQQKLRLYPFPANLLFERSLHFMARLKVKPAQNN
jgi:SAM-dependent methyltransferase